MGRDLLFGAAVGVALYKGSQIDSYSKPVNYFLNEDFSNPLTCSFDNLQDDVEYTLCPYVMWGDSSYPGEPIHTFTLKKEENNGLVGHRKSKSIHKDIITVFPIPKIMREWDMDIDNGSEYIFFFSDGNCHQYL